VFPQEIISETDKNRSPLLLQLSNTDSGQTDGKKLYWWAISSYKTGNSLMSSSLLGSSVSAIGKMLLVNILLTIGMFSAK